MNRLKIMTREQLKAEKQRIESGLWGIGFNPEYKNAALKIIQDEINKSLMTAFSGLPPKA